MHSVQSFRRNSDGNIAVTFALCAVVVLVAIGVALDYSRSFSHQQKIQAVLDASLLHVVHDASSMDDEQLSQAVTGMVVDRLADTMDLRSVAITVSRAGNVISATGSGRVPTTLMTFAGIDSVDVSVQSAVTAGSRPVEIAMVIDVTGSMAANMPKLREGVQQLVDIVAPPGNGGNMRVAIVPFVGAVNIGNQLSHEAWLDKDGLSQHAGQTVRGRRVAVSTSPACAGLKVTDPDPNHRTWLDELIPNVVKSAFQAVFSTGEAHAGTPYSYTRDGCYYRNPARVSNWQLFQNLSNVAWKGCVEARPIPYDLEDVPPSFNPDTRWVPFFSLDGNDADVFDDTGTRYRESGNTYIDDDPLPDTDMATSDFGRAYSVLKYKNQPIPALNENPPLSNGPNKNCPSPILPLTSDHAALTESISDLNDWFNGGTNTAEGIAWGLRVLSPGEPFTEGAPYGEVEKIMVVFSDGVNDVAGEATGVGNNPTMPFVSEYSSYGYARHGRYGANGLTQKGRQDFLNDRMDVACKIVKSNDITIFVIAYGAGAQAIANLTKCATSPDHIMIEARGDSLAPAFQKIARKIAPPRLTR